MIKPLSKDSAQREHRFKCSILPFDVYKSYILVNPFSVYMCAFCVYLIILIVSPWHHIVKPEWRYNLLITVLMWQVLLVFFVVVFFLHVLTSEGGSVCLGVAILCTVMCFLGFITSCPNLLSCFVSSCLPPSPLLLFPPYRLCVCHICYQGNGTECNQNHASLSDYGGTVPLSTYFSFPLVPSHTRCCPLCCKDEEPVRGDGVHSS